MEQRGNNLNQGALFCNDKKTKDNQPVFRGSINANGVEMWISGWQKVSKNGVSYMSLSLSKKEQKQGDVTSQVPPKKEPTQEELGLELPF